MAYNNTVSSSSPIKQQFFNALVGKVEKALGVGVPPQELHDDLRQKAMMARNAEQRAALLEAAGVALTAVSRDQAGSITQAGLKNQAYTPQYGAQQAIGAGLAGVQRADADYQKNLGNIQVQEEQAAAAAKQQEFDNKIAQDRSDAYAAQVAAQTLAAQPKPPVVDTADTRYTAWISDIGTDQGKNLSFGNEAITGDAQLTAIENSGDYDPELVENILAKALLTDDESGAVIGLNDAILREADPKYAAYLRATMKVVTSKLRKESGAAISPSEWRTEITKIMPSSKKEFRSAQEYRRRLIQTLSTSSGAPTLEGFYKGIGFKDGKYNADLWFSELFGAKTGSGTTTTNITWTVK